MITLSIRGLPLLPPLMSLASLPQSLTAEKSRRISPLLTKESLYLPQSMVDNPKETPRSK